MKPAGESKDTGHDAGETTRSREPGNHESTATEIALNRPADHGWRSVHTVAKHDEITACAMNDAASLGRLMAVAVSCGSEVLAACSYWGHAGTVVRLVTEDARRTIHALEAAGFECKSNLIILVEAPYNPTLVALVEFALTAAGIDISYSYSSFSGRGRSYVVFKTTDDARAIRILESDKFVHDLLARKTSLWPVMANIDEHDKVRQVI